MLIIFFVAIFFLMNFYWQTIIITFCPFNISSLSPILLYNLQTLVNFLNTLVLDPLLELFRLQLLFLCPLIIILEVSPIIIKYSCDSMTQQQSKLQSNNLILITIRFIWQILIAFTAWKSEKELEISTKLWLSYVILKYDLDVFPVFELLINLSLFEFAYLMMKKQKLVSRCQLRLDLIVKLFELYTSTEILIQGICF